MTVPDDYWSRVSSLPAFRRSVALATHASVLIGLPDIVVNGDARRGDLDWSRALFVASLVSTEAPEALHDGALRIAQVCLQSGDSDPDHRAAALLLLERLGNARAIQLAQRKGLISRDGEEVLGAPMELDIARKRMMLTIDSSFHGALHVNDFQRQFWRAAEANRWVSVSAATSTGKSYIVKRWLIERLSQAAHVHCAYVVPTRALIEEVSRDLIEALAGLAKIFTLPWDADIGEAERAVFVVTQERLHLLQQRFPNNRLDLIFLDEAQKFGDGRRGILLQRVLDDATATSPDLQVLFASPLATNPELLIRGATGTATSLVSEVVTVNQNLIHANQRRGNPMLWDADVVVGGERQRVGSFTLPARPQPQGKRLSLVAVALGRGHSGNVVYVNGAAEAEKVAGHIYDALGSERDMSANGDVAALIELIEKTIHPQYLLARSLRRGVAFHYGNMPLLLRQEIERLFKEGTLQYLVCTSTLLEGVNLPCQNIFVRGPKKGNGRPMSPADFWNLAGRAGRWGIEFQGNVVCVDTDDGHAWDSVPLARVRQPIVRATDVAVRDLDALLNFVESGTPVSESRLNPVLESLVSLLASRRTEDGVSPAEWLPIDNASSARLYEVLEQSLGLLTIPQSLIDRHAGISPFSIERLADYFRSYGNPSRLLLTLPESPDAVEAYVRAISRIDRILGGDFSSVPGRQFQIAVLLVNWMRGRPLSRLIRERVDYWKGRPNSPSLPTVIRSVMADVEQLARYQAPLYLACYAEVLAESLPAFMASVDPIPDVAMMLELGVSRSTEVSMMSLGLSRTTVVALQEHIVNDSLTANDCIAWLRDNDLVQLGLPVLVIREVQVALLRLGVEGSI